MATNGTNHNEGLAKDEVGWYFVEQYYTTLSKNPNRLHLFYGKKSQLVYGTETEVADVSVGRQNIQERITKLDFQDCKVRVSNVDSQASLDNILIQVIGEISNKSEDSRKFVQTFVLAEQQSGYFVLNDIFRYIKEEETESTDAAAPAEEDKAAAAEEAEPVEIQSQAPAKAEEAEAVKPQLDAAVVDKKLEEAAEKAPAAPAVATPAEAAPKAVVPAIPAVPAVATPAAAPDAEKAEKEVAEEEQKKTEAPKEPAPTPAVAPAAAPAATPAAVPAAAPAAPVAATPAEPEKPKGPPKPMTWASRAAAAAGPARSAAVPKPAAPASPAAAAAAPAKPAAAAAAAAAAPAAVAAAKAADAESKDSGSEWQTAGADSKRQNRPQSISGPPQDKDSALGYVKYVTDKVDEAALRSHLETFGPVVYFDISRTKNCAFIEFGSPAGYQAAVAANPHTINGETILVEARRPKAGAYGGSNYNPNRGNIANRGRGGFEGRNGSQGGGRGGFNGPNRGRGGAGASRGRGGAQLAA